MSKSLPTVSTETVPDCVGVKRYQTEAPPLPFGSYASRGGSMVSRVAFSLESVSVPDIPINGKAAENELLDRPTTTELLEVDAVEVLVVLLAVT